MNNKIILIFFLFCFSFSFLFSAHHEYKLYDSFYDKYSHSKFDVAISIMPINTFDDNIVICQGNTTNLNNYVTSEITYRNMDILSFCNSLIGVGTDAEGQYICGGGYSTTSGSNALKSGNIVPISPTERTALFNTFTAKTFYFSRHPNFEKYLINEGKALLSKFPLWGQTPQNIDKALGDVGVGCTGSYEYVLKKERFGFALGQVYTYYQEIDRYTGQLDGTGKNYRFDEIGNYRVEYDYSVKNCFTLFEEKFGGTTYVHLFREQIKSPTEISGTRTLNLQVVSTDEPSYNVEGEGAICGISGTSEVELVKGEEVTIRGSMKIKNDYTVPIRITEINAIYRRPGGILATPDIEVGDIRLGSWFPLYLPITIQPGSERTIIVNIPSKLKEDVEDAPDEYILALIFNHEYDAHPQGCHPAGSGVGYCNDNLRISVEEEEEPEPVRTLSATVNVDPKTIDVGFIRGGESTVDVFGEVSLITTINGDSETQKIGGADVTLTGLMLNMPTKNINCLEGELPTTKTLTNPTTQLGNYRFNNVRLRDGCLEYDLLGSLRATIRVRYEDLSTLEIGEGSVNTLLGPLSCELSYKLVSSNYRPGEGEEIYEIFVEVSGDYELADEIEYKCGIDEDEEWKTTSKDDPTFNCEYEFDLIKAEDIIYVVRVKVKDDITSGREAFCSANIGMCLPYI